MEQNYFTMGRTVIGVDASESIGTLEPWRKSIGLVEVTHEPLSEDGRRKDLIHY